MYSPDEPSPLFGVTQDDDDFEPPRCTCDIPPLRDCETCIIEDLDASAAFRALCSSCQHQRIMMQTGASHGEAFSDACCCVTPNSEEECNVQSSLIGLTKSWCYQLLPLECGSTEQRGLKASLFGLTQPLVKAVTTVGRSECGSHAAVARCVSRRHITVEVVDCGPAVTGCKVTAVGGGFRLQIGGGMHCMTLPGSSVFVSDMCVLELVDGAKRVVCRMCIRQVDTAQTTHSI